MQRGRGRGRKQGFRGGGRDNWGRGGQDFHQDFHQGGGGMGGGMGPPPMGMDPMMAGGWNPMVQGGGMGGPGMVPGPGMGGPGMMPGPGMMQGGPMMDGPGMQQQQQQFGYNEGPMQKRMRHIDEGMPPGGMQGPMGSAQMQQQPPQQQQQRAPGWAGTIANDYCQNFVDTGLRPQNYLGDLLVDDPLAEYPVQRELRDAKIAQVASFHTPPYGIRANLKQLKLSQDFFGTRFDVVLIDPPWEEYVRRAPGFIKDQDSEVWSWQHIMDLDIGAIADNPSFVFLWCGCEEGLDAGRHCLDKWGFRRIEDICWIKTNRRRDTEADHKYLSAQHQDPHSTIVHTKEHCLVGIKGKVIRREDHAFVHANCDTDIIVSEEPPLGSTEKPEELYSIIERFCNGRRRMELFGEDHNMRPGWVTVGKNISTTNFKAKTYTDHFRDSNGKPYVSHHGLPPPAGAPILVPTTATIERNRPRSPPPGAQNRR